MHEDAMNLHGKKFKVCWEPKIGCRLFFFAIGAHGLTLRKKFL